MNQTYAFPWPVEGDRLFDSDGTFHVMGDMAESLASGYKAAGDAIVEAFQLSRYANRDLLFPAMYCYRQYIELKLKLVTARISYHACLPKDAMDYKRMGGHDLLKLWGNMQSTIDEHVGETSHSDDERMAHEQVQSCVEELDKIDHQGDGFRYPETGTTKKLHEINPFHVKRVIEDIESYLDALHDYCTAGER